MENFERCNLFKFHFNWDRLQRSILADEPPTPPSGHIYNWIESFSGGVIVMPKLFRFDVVQYTILLIQYNLCNGQFFFNITFKTLLLNNKVCRNKIYLKVQGVAGSGEISLLQDSSFIVTRSDPE